MMAPFLNFVPAPVVAPGGGTDPSFANVVLLLAGDGSDGGTTITDDSPSAHTVNVVNNVTTRTANKMFGTAALDMIGNAGSGMTYSDHVDWRLGPTNSDPWTIEGFAYFDAIDNADALICQYDGVSGNLCWIVFVLGGGTELGYRNHTDGTNGTIVDVVTSGLSLTTGTWYYWAVSKNASQKIRIHAGAVSGGTVPMLASSTPANTFHIDSTAELSIFSCSGFQNAFGGNKMDGQQDEIRLTKGVCRYDTDSAIAVPTAAFPRS